MCIRDRFYSDKYAKVGIQVSELFDEELLREKLERICVQKNVILEHLYHKPTLNVDELMDTLREYRKMVEPYVCDVSAFLYEAREQGKRILLEGQLGSLKDPDHGIYPMVTSVSYTHLDVYKRQYYDQIMGALLQSKAKGTKISALVIWSLYDGVSWRASSAPCLFNGLYSPKSAFFAVANAKDAYK